MKHSVITLALAGNVAAFWRMPCRSATGIARIDPLVAPNDVADHSHIVFGGGNFGQNTTFDTLAKPEQADYDCTSCNVRQDKSAYWTPPLYFMHANGSVEMVENVGGMLAYYLFYLDNLQPFPEGFQMIAGDPSFRNFSGPFPDEPLSSWPTDPTDQFFLKQCAIGFNCLTYAMDPEPSLYRHTFPDKAMLDNVCKDGVRLEMAFPSCGNGQPGSPDHRSHVAYPSLVKEGNCPEGYDVHYPFLFYETIFATQRFAGLDGHFVLSTGDPIGTSYHADFIMGWNSADFLRQAINTCTSLTGRIEDCPLFDIQTDDEAAKCKFSMPEDLDGEDCAGPRDGLPVGVPIQWGPEPAKKYPVAGAYGKGESKPNAPPENPKPAAPVPPAYAPPDSPKPSAPVPPAYAPVGPVAYGKASSSAPPPAITPAPPSSTTEAPGCETTYVTKGNEVWEIIVEEVAVTVTVATTLSGSPATPSAPSYQHKRHVEKHARHHQH